MKIRPSLLSIFALVALTGCGSLVTERAATVSTLHGNVHGGQQPIVGASVQLYAAGTDQDGGAAVALLAQPAITGSYGEFTLSAYTCPSPDALTYIISTGGNPGLGSNSVNPQATLMVALGPCGDLMSLPFIQGNEVSTVAALYPLAEFATSYSSIGSSPAHVPAFSSDFAEVNNLFNIATGTSPGAALPAGLNVPSGAINALADVIATCINSPGGKAGDNTPCGQLFTLATPPGGVAPTNTADALIDIFQNPTQNTAAIFDLISATGPFQPALKAPPSDWTIRPTPTVAARSSLIGEYLLTEGSGNTAYDTSGHGNDAAINGPLWEGSTDLSFPDQGKNVQLPAAINAARSWQIALYEPPLGFAKLPLAPGYGDATSLPANPSVLCGSTKDQLCIISAPPSSTSRFGAVNDNTESAVAMTPGWHILSYLCGGSYNGVISKTHILYDGVEVPSYLYQGDVNTCPVPAAGNYFIGGSSLYTQTWFTGRIAAFWAWDTELSLADASTSAAVGMAYIRSKGVPANYANANNSAPIILAGFDSRTRGEGLVDPNQPWPAQMAIGKNFTRVNLSSSGSTAFDWCYQYDLVYGEQIPKTPGGPVVTLIWGGLNDAEYGQQTTAQISASLQCMVKAAKAHNSLVVLATEISSFGSDPSGDRYKDAITAVIRASAYGWGVDSVVDLATDAVLGADGASKNTALFPDGVHPSAAGHTRIAAMMSNAVNELTGSTGSAPNHTNLSAYQELASDGYLVLTGSSAQTVALPSCVGYSLSRFITNSGTTTASLQTVNAEIVSGTSSIPPGGVVSITPVPGDVTTGGCSWAAVSPSADVSALPQRENLLAEYLLKDGTGSTAHDSSGKQHDGTILGGTWDGTVDLDLRPGTSNIQVPAELNAARSWMIAYYQAPWGTLAAPQATGYGALSVFPSIPSLLCHSTGQSGGPCFISSSQAFVEISQHYYANNTDKTELLSPISAGWHVWTLLCGSNVNGVVTKTHYLVDGAEPAYKIQGDAGTCPIPTSGNFAVGGNSADPNTQFSGKLAGVWAWNTPLSVAEASSAAKIALNFMRDKGVPSSYPPLVTQTPTIYAGFDGNSVPDAVGASQLWESQLKLTDPTFSVQLLGTPGASASEGCSMFDLTFGQYLGAGSAPVIFAWWGGIDDILQYTNYTTADHAANLQCMVQKAKALGARVVLATEISGVSSNGYVADPGKNELNAIIRAQAFSWGVDNLADLATDPTLGADGAYLNHNCFIDGVHISAACESNVAAIMQNSLNELLGSTQTAHHSTASSSYNEAAGDRFLDLTGSSSPQSVTLPGCTGYSLSRTVNNGGSFAASVYSGPAVLGTVPPGASARLTPVPRAGSSGGCDWTFAVK